MNTLQTFGHDLYRYREVLWNLFQQEMKIKYKRTTLGYFWSLLNPILQLTVLAAVFSHIVKLAVKDYTLYLFSGLLAWNFFQATTQTSASALLENENFIKKIYLPKFLFPLSKLCMRSVEFLFSFVALSLLGSFIGFKFKMTLLLLPLPILFLFIFTFGISLMVSVATIYFRDMQYLLTVFLQLLYFATPIMYPAELLPPNYLFALRLNPVYSQINLFHKLIYDGVIPTGTEWGVAAAVAFCVLGAGISVMRAFEYELVFRM